MRSADLFSDPAAEAIREAEGCEYVAQGWRGSAAQARRDGFAEAAERYDVEAARWESMAAEHRARARKVLGGLDSPLERRDALSDRETVAARDLFDEGRP